MPLAGEFLKAMKTPLFSWLDTDDKESWYLATNTLPVCNNLFLELHTSSKGSRCDIITSLVYSDGTLSDFLSESNSREGVIWHNTVDFLEKWHEQLKGKDGLLKRHIFSIWLEFDLQFEHYTSIDPSIFIALTPYVNFNELAEEAVDYPGFKESLQNSIPWLEDLRKDDPILLGHIGYMAPRYKGKSTLFLRSCWRCNNLSHFLELLRQSGVSFNQLTLHDEIKWIYEIETDINSYLLDLDSNKTGFRPEFSLELNVYNPYSSYKEDILLNKITELGFISIEQKQKFQMFSGDYILSSEQPFNSALHHIKLKFKDSKIVEVKCYWRASLKPRLW